MPAFGWGATTYDLWWTVVTAIILGVGIGVLAQPQLMVRFMTVRSRRELDRAVPIGAVFILLMIGTPFVVGSLSNAWFAQHGPLLQRQGGQGDSTPTRGHALVGLMKESDPGALGAGHQPQDRQAGHGAPMVVAAREPAQDAAGAALRTGPRAGPVHHLRQGRLRPDHPDLHRHRPAALVRAGLLPGPAGGGHEHHVEPVPHHRHRRRARPLRAPHRQGRRASPACWSCASPSWSACWWP